MQPQQNNLLETDLLKTFVTISETGNLVVSRKWWKLDGGVISG